MAEINLLPKNLSPKGGLFKILKVFKKINIIGSIAFLFLAIFLLGYILINSRSLTNLSADQEKLRSSIKSMQQVEQQYTLVKDRLSLIEKSLASGDLEEELNTFEKLVGILPSGVEILAAEFSSKDVEMQLIIPNSDFLRETITKLSASDLYSKIIIGSFSLKQGSGYQVGLETYQD